MTDLRASDADRESCVQALRHHAHDGRLDVDELEERIAAAYRAKTVRELAALRTDLPDLDAPPPAPRPEHRLPRVPGTMPFFVSWHAPTGVQTTMSELLTLVAPPLSSHGYRLVETSPTRLRFQWSKRPLWTIAVAILVFPIGLIALLYQQKEDVTLELTEVPGGTRVTAGGVAPLTVRRGFAQLED